MPRRLQPIRAGLRFTFAPPVTALLLMMMMTASPGAMAQTSPAPAAELVSQCADALRSYSSLVAGSYIPSGFSDSQDKGRQQKVDDLNRAFNNGLSDLCGMTVSQMPTWTKNIQAEAAAKEKDHKIRDQKKARASFADSVEKLVNDVLVHGQSVSDPSWKHPALSSEQNKALTAMHVFLTSHPGDLPVWAAVLMNLPNQVIENEHSSAGSLQTVFDIMSKVQEAGVRFMNREAEKRSLSGSSAGDSNSQGADTSGAVPPLKPKAQ